MIILGVDLGDRRSGLALCTPDESFVSPAGCIVSVGRTALAKELACKAESFGAGLIVLGLPVNMDGSEGFRARAVREFAAILREYTDIPTEFLDERLSTMQAARLLDEGSVYGKKRKDAIDTQSAVIILEDYLARRRSNASRS